RSEGGIVAAKWNTLVGLKLASPVQHEMLVDVAHGSFTSFWPIRPTSAHPPKADVLVFRLLPIADIDGYSIPSSARRAAGTAMSSASSACIRWCAPISSSTGC